MFRLVKIPHWSRVELEGSGAVVYLRETKVLREDRVRTHRAWTPEVAKASLYSRAMLAERSLSMGGRIRDPVTGNPVTVAVEVARGTDNG